MISTLKCNNEHYDLSIPPGAVAEPYVAVDRFMADPEEPMAPQVAGDLFRTPLLLEQHPHLLQLGRGEPGIAPGPHPAPAPVPAGQLGAVGAVALAAWLRQTSRTIVLRCQPSTRAIAAGDSPRRRSSTRSAWSSSVAASCQRRALLGSQ